MKSVILAAALVASASAHGMVRSIQGANGVEMPGLTVADGTPRDCSSNGCGSQADSAIIRQREIRSGEASPLGRTQGAGPVSAADGIATFMGSGNGNGTARPASAASIAQDLAADPDKRKRSKSRSMRVRQLGASENLVGQMAGTGAESGLPTASDNGEVTMTFYSVNADGGGPLNAMIDPTSGGTQMGAFEQAEVTQDVPGFLGFGRVTMSENPITVQMPAGMTCEGSVGGADNVCIVRVNNNTPAGPFGGAAAFTQSSAGRKRALEYRRKMKRSQ
ncbi:uncharacterized protein AB675_3292 [Cyphellophora attinorum]|uniref:Cell surface protein n=1 Tax=Cyphellophora attinorum TaxID=1664694 RepID=A0A0N1P089_9EURO|nr:uncharacterized protein AB675_3292 [Phialophora attinorum]KPI39586.1 hypothetical protein AB675_3292 [Phialophora attinorum]